MPQRLVFRVRVCLGKHFVATLTTDVRKARVRVKWGFLSFQFHQLPVVFLLGASRNDRIRMLVGGRA